MRYALADADGHALLHKLIQAASRTATIVDDGSSLRMQHVSQADP
jgi:hypothetical protein